MSPGESTSFAFFSLATCRSLLPAESAPEGANLLEGGGGGAIFVSAVLLFETRDLMSVSHEENFGGEDPPFSMDFGVDSDAVSSFPSFSSFSPCSASFFTSFSSAFSSIFSSTCSSTFSSIFSSVISSIFSSTFSCAFSSNFSSNFSSTFSSAFSSTSSTTFSSAAVSSFSSSLLSNSCSCSAPSLSVSLDGSSSVFGSSILSSLGAFDASASVLSLAGGGGNGRSIVNAGTFRGALGTSEGRGDVAVACWLTSLLTCSASA
mmetsp:Transcript_137314/g.325249  ORF Transcript_137314/g.325249 Transcript_137314/m.325249 type:complete len:262 (-) Transcript_137314:2164-2949(-)